MLSEKPAAQMLCFRRVPMGGNFTAQRHQQPEECLSHGERHHSFFMHLYSTSSLVLLGAPAETQSWWSWDKNKGFGVLIQLQVGRFSIMLWFSQVGLGCYPGVSLYPGKAPGALWQLGTIPDPMPYFKKTGFQHYGTFIVAPQAVCSEPTWRTPSCCLAGWT